MPPNSRYGSLDHLRWVQYVPGSAGLDAFGRLRVSQPTTLFDSKLTIDNQPLAWDDQQTAGTASSAYNANQASVTLSVSENTAGTRVRQTFRRFNYQPGKSQLVLMTGVIGAATSGVTKRWGLFDGSNGLYFKQTSSGLSIVERTYVSGSMAERETAQADWSAEGRGLPDDFDITKTQIWWIDYEWLGVGTVRYGVFHQGVPVTLHVSHHNNALTTVYMSTPNLPLRFEIVASGTNAAGSLTAICCTVISEGGTQNVGREFSVDRGITGLATLSNTSLYPLLALRLKSTHLSADVTIKNIETLCTTAADWRWAILVNPTVTGTALSFADVTNSALQAAVGATNATTVSAGTQLESGYGTGTATFRSVVAQTGPEVIRLGSTIAGASDVIVLAVQNVSSAVETYFGSISWTENF